MARESHSYTQLSDAAKQTRLIQLHPNLSHDWYIQCSLHIADLCQRRISQEPRVCGRGNCQVDHEASPWYAALSYTWGDPNDLRQILVDGHLLSIRANLWYFLDMYRHKVADGQDPVLWIDQISIDQENLPERSAQVSQMAMIFHGATHVVAWLGVGTEYERQAVEILQKIKLDATKTGRSNTPEGNTSSPEPSVVFLPTIYSDVSKLFDNPYWSRLWVIQEIRLARLVIWSLGSMTLSHKTLTEFCRKMCGIGSRSDFPRDFVRLLGEHETTALGGVLQQYSDAKCSDPRDKVFGLLSLIDSKERIDVDYTLPKEEVLGRVLDILVTVNGTIDPGSRLVIELGIPQRWWTLYDKLRLWEHPGFLAPAIRLLSAVLINLRRIGLDVTRQRWPAEKQVEIALLAWNLQPNLEEGHSNAGDEIRKLIEKLNGSEAVQVPAAYSFEYPEYSPMSSPRLYTIEIPNCPTDLSRLAT